MTDLASKFTTLEQQLTEQHNALIDVLTATNNKLDAIATALGAPPPTGQTTLADIATILNYIHTDTESIDLKLLRIRDGLTADPSFNYVNVQQVLGLFAARFDQSVGVLGTDADESLMRMLAAVESHIGFPTGDATTTVLGRLAAIQSYSSCACGPQQPQPGDTGGCASPFVSQSFTQTSATYPGRVFVVWPSPLPSGALFDDTLSLGVDRVELMPEANWNGWRLFVYSKSAGYYTEDPTRTVQWPTNVWRNLDPNQSYPLAISVAAGNDAVGYLCAPVDLPNITTCSMFSSISYTFSGQLFYVIRTPPIYSGNDIFTSGDFYGYTVRLVTFGGGSDIRVDHYNTSDVYNSGSLMSTVDTIITISEHTNALGIHTNIPDAGNPFSVEVCPPTPG